MTTTTSALAQKFIDTVIGQPDREIQVCLKGSSPIAGKAKIERYMRTSDTEETAQAICTILCEAQIGTAAPTRMPFTFDPADLLWFSTGPEAPARKSALWGS